MARIGFLTAMVVLIVPALAADPEPNSLTPQEKAAGWQLLFDGRSMVGWKDPRAMNPPGDSWTIEDSCLKALARPKINEDLFSNATYRDFEFQWDWKIAPGGNSGIKYRIQRTVWLTADHPKVPHFEDVVQWFIDHPVDKRPDKGQNYVIGFEYQMVDNKANADALSAATRSAGALYDMVAPVKDATRPAGEWNHSVLRVRGEHVEHWLNGEKVVDSDIDPSVIKTKLERRWGKSPGVFRLLGDQPERDCPISLQNHESDTWFRNLKIRRL